jgi:hypothetical protein
VKTKILANRSRPAALSCCSIGSNARGAKTAANTPNVAPFSLKGTLMPERPVFIPKQDRTEKPDPASQPDKTIKQDWGGTQPPVRSPIEPPVSSAE